MASVGCELMKTMKYQHCSWFTFFLGNLIIKVHRSALSTFKESAKKCKNNHSKIRLLCIKITVTVWQWGHRVSGEGWLHIVTSSQVTLHWPQTSVSVSASGNTLQGCQLCYVESHGLWNYLYFFFVLTGSVHSSNMCNVMMWLLALAIISALLSSV